MVHTNDNHWYSPRDPLTTSRLTLLEIGIRSGSQPAHDTSFIPTEIDSCLFDDREKVVVIVRHGLERARFTQARVSATMPEQIVVARRRWIERVRAVILEEMPIFGPGVVFVFIVLDGDFRCR